MSKRMVIYIPDSLSEERIEKLMDSIYAQISEDEEGKSWCEEEDNVRCWVEEE